MTPNATDVVIIGGGPAGATCALYLLAAGLKPVILERETFPRYHIGESLTGEVGGMLRDLGLEPLMNAGRYPVKHGVTVYGTGGRNSFWVPVAKRVDANHLEETTTWQVRRSEFDQMLLDTAIARGSTLLPCRALAPRVEAGAVTGVYVQTPRGTKDVIVSKVLIDASGQSTFLANSDAPTSPKQRGRYDRQVAVFSQVTNTWRDSEQAPGNTLIFYQRKNQWGWFIPLDEERVSVGVVVPGEYYRQEGLTRPDFLKTRLRDLNPELSKRVPELTFVEDVHAASSYSYEVRHFTGKGFACVGDSHRFIDPIFSFGVNVAMKEARYAAAAIVRQLSGEIKAQNPFADYERFSNTGQDIIQSLVDVFWEHPLSFLHLIQHSHRDGMIDLFAGRVFENDVMDSKALKALRKCLDTGTLVSEEAESSSPPPC